MEAEAFIRLLIKSGQSFEPLREEPIRVDPAWTLWTLKEHVHKCLGSPEPAHMILVLQADQMQQKLEGEERTLFCLGLVSDCTIYLYSEKVWTAQQSAVDVLASEGIRHQEDPDPLLDWLGDSSSASETNDAFIPCSVRNEAVTVLAYACLDLRMAKLLECWGKRADAFHSSSGDSGLTVAPILAAFRELVTLAHVNHAFRKAFDSWVRNYCCSRAVMKNHSPIVGHLAPCLREKLLSRDHQWSPSALWLISMCSVTSTAAYVSRSSLSPSRPSLIAPRGRYMLLELMHLRLPSPASSVVMYVVLKTWSTAASDLFRPRPKGGHCVLSLAARACGQDAFQVLSSSVTIDSFDAFLREPMKTPLREAIDSGNASVVRYILSYIGEKGDDDHWATWIGLAGCNCKLRHENQNEARELDPDDPVQLMKPVHSHGKWEDDLILVALARKREATAHMLLESWPKRSDAPWIHAVGDVHLEACILNHCSIEMFERLLKLRTYLIPFTPPIVASVLPPRTVASVSLQVWRCAIACKHVVLMEHLLSVPIFIWGTAQPTEECLLDACHVQCSAAVELILCMGQVLPTRAACIKAATNADAACLKVLLGHAKEHNVLQQCVLRDPEAEHGGVLHALCQAKSASHGMLADTFGVILEATTRETSSMRGGETDDVALDDLSWFDEHDHLPVHYATGPFHDMLARLFPADALWNQLEIDVGLQQLVGVIHPGGHSKASIQKWSYMDKSCQVAVKRYPKSKMQEIKRELGIMSRMRFPYVVHMLGWCALEGENIGVVMHAYARNLHSVLPDCLFEQKCRWMRQVGAALKYMHAQRPPITHGDVHAMNILLTNDPFDEDGGVPDAVLCDFDFSSIQGTRTSQLSKLSLLVDLFRHPQGANGSLDERDFPQANDWLLYGFLLFATSSTTWDWRSVSRRLLDGSSYHRLPSLMAAEDALRLPSGALNLVAEFVHSRFDPRIQRDRNLDCVSTSLLALQQLKWLVDVCPGTNCNSSLPSTF